MRKQHFDKLMSSRRNRFSFAEMNQSNQNSPTSLNKPEEIEENHSFGDSPSTRHSLKKKGHRRIGSGSKKTYESVPTQTRSTQTQTTVNDDNIPDAEPKAVCKVFSDSKSSLKMFFQLFFSFKE
jgi:hypothetical protein